MSRVSRRLIQMVRSLGRQAATSAIVVCAVAACAREGGQAGGSGPSNDLLIVGYDREPDTLNRFSTHILEDIQTCVVEGLVTTRREDERRPAARGRGPHAGERRRGAARRRRDGRHVEASPGRDVARRHRRSPRPTSSSPSTRSTTPNYNPESTDGFDRITSVDTPDSLTAVVHYKEVYAPYEIQFMRGALPEARARGTATSTRPPTTTATRSARDRTRSPSGRRANTSCSSKVAELLARRRVSEDQAHPLPLRPQHHHAHQPAQERRGARGRAGAVGQVPRTQGRARR